MVSLSGTFVLDKAPTCPPGLPGWETEGKAILRCDGGGKWILKVSFDMGGGTLTCEGVEALDAEGAVASDAEQNSPTLDLISCYTCGHASGYSDGFFVGCWCSSPAWCPDSALVNLLILLQHCCWCPESLLQALPDGVVSANGFHTVPYDMAQEDTSGKPFVEVESSTKEYCKAYLDEMVHLFMALDLSAVTEHPRLGAALMALASTSPHQQQALLTRAFLVAHPSSRGRAGTSAMASQLLQQAMHEAKLNSALRPRLWFHMTGQVLQLACRHPVGVYEVMAYIDLQSVIKDGHAAARLCEELAQCDPEEGMVHRYGYKIYLNLAKMQLFSDHVGDFFDKIFADTPASRIAQMGMGNFVVSEVLKFPCSRRIGQIGASFIQNLKECFDAELAHYSLQTWLEVTQEPCQVASFAKAFARLCLDLKDNRGQRTPAGHVAFKLRHAEQRLGLDSNVRSDWIGVRAFTNNETKASPMEEAPKEDAPRTSTGSGPGTSPMEDAPMEEKGAK